MVAVVTSSFVVLNWCSAELGIARAMSPRLMPVRGEAGVVHPLMLLLRYADYEADRRLAREQGARGGAVARTVAGGWPHGA